MVSAVNNLHNLMLLFFFLFSFSPKEMYINDFLRIPLIKLW